LKIGLVYPLRTYILLPDARPGGLVHSGLSLSVWLYAFLSGSVPRPSIHPPNPSSFISPSSLLADSTKGMKPIGLIASVLNPQLPTPVLCIYHISPGIVAAKRSRVAMMLMRVAGVMNRLLRRPRLPVRCTGGYRSGRGDLRGVGIRR
jgi:hypothetical protein